MAITDNSLEALQARITELESRSAIRDLVSDYMHGFDQSDLYSFLSLWWVHCIWYIGSPFGRFEGHAVIRDAVLAVLWPVWQESHHLTTNLRIEFTDASNAQSMCDVDCVGTLTDDPAAQIVGATYRDQLQARDGQWRILKRDVTIHYFNPLGGTTLSPPQDTS